MKNSGEKQQMCHTVKKPVAGQTTLVIPTMMVEETCDVWWVMKGMYGLDPLIKNVPDNIDRKNKIHR
jgi:hypothetical protein